MEYVFSDRLKALSGTATREILKLTQGGDILSFAGGLPARECLPVGDIEAILQELMQSGGLARVLQYGISEGTAALRAAFGRVFLEDGIEADPDETVIVSGGQQGLELCCKAFVNRGDAVLVEDPTYLAFLQIVKSYEGRPVGVRSTDEGLDLNDLEEKMKTLSPKLLYVVPTFSNPTGKTYTAKNRRALLALAERYGVMIVEDDPYAKLRFSGQPVPPIKSLDKTGRVIYIQSLSKVFSPGLRVAAVAAAKPVAQKLVVGKQNTDLHTGALSQYAAQRFLESGKLNQNIAAGIHIYRERKEAMAAALDRYIPAGVCTRTDPEGGLFVWCELDKRIDTDRLFARAVEQRIAFVPGRVFFADGSGGNTLRLNFSNAPPKDIDRGMEILGRLIGQTLANSAKISYNKSE
ncbi:MAG: PLP-dependent aminotransferase family protein [Clostridiales bacterium]|jgi:2-aminoadipate transaminase|nr:PLP-dependent aminotransferase family protein [Clostridiales bacterium]